MLLNQSAFSNFVMLIISGLIVGISVYEQLLVFPYYLFHLRVILYKYKRQRVLPLLGKRLNLHQTLK